MYLFIFESIGTQELILVGMIALIVFGPRKLPVMARKAGKFMKELRSVSDGFRETWEKEIDFESDDSPKEIETENDVYDEPFVNEGVTFGEEIAEVETSDENENKILPEIKEVSKEDFDKLVASQKELETKPIDTSASEKSEWF